MKQIKKIWLWISGGIAILFGLFVVIFKFIIPNQQRRSDFKQKNREIEKEKKELEKKVVGAQTKKADLKRNIKILETKIEKEYHLLQDHYPHSGQRHRSP